MQHMGLRNLTWLTQIYNTNDSMIQSTIEKEVYAWFNSTCYHRPPGHTPRYLQFCSYLAVYSPPLGTQKETIPYPRDSS